MERVTLRINVPHTDHSQVIGRGGYKIKGIMLDTQCQIHFPDTNRIQLAKKSDVVSIKGAIEHVDAARKRIRAMLPISFTFKVSGSPESVHSPSQKPAIISEVERFYAVDVTWRTLRQTGDWRADNYELARASNGAEQTVVSVKSIAENSKPAKLATQRIIDHFQSQNRLPEICVQTRLELDYTAYRYFSFLTSPRPSSSSATSTMGTPSGNPTCDVASTLARIVYQATGAKLSLTNNSLKLPFHLLHLLNSSSQANYHNQQSSTGCNATQAMCAAWPLQIGNSVIPPRRLSAMLKRIIPSTCTSSSSAALTLLNDCPIVGNNGNSISRHNNPDSLLLEIAGSVDSVFMARQLVTGLFPVSLLFDVTNDEASIVGQFDVQQLLINQYDVSMYLRDRQWLLRKSVNLTTTEKNIQALYAARNLIMEMFRQATQPSLHRMRNCNNPPEPVKSDRVTNLTNGLEARINRSADIRFRDGLKLQPDGSSSSSTGGDEASPLDWMSEPRSAFSPFSCTAESTVVGQSRQQLSLFSASKHWSTDASDFKDVWYSPNSESEYKSFF